MKQNLGLIATFTLLLGVIGVSTLPKTSTERAVSQQATSKSKVVTQPPSGTHPSRPESACEEIARRVSSLLPKPLDLSKELPRSCYAEQNQPTDQTHPGSSDGLSIVIATAPNPVSTHLPLMFDRLIEVIQQAAEDDDYTYDSSWFPWNETSKDYALRVDQKLAEDEQEEQQKQPGVIVFRRALRDQKDPLPYTGGLIVFVVAEQPTGGIDSAEFENAVRWTNRLGSLTTQRDLKILGPTFSGSLPSLAKELAPEAFAGILTQDPAPETLAKGLSKETLKSLRFQVSSGSVSSELSYSWFKKSLDSRLKYFDTATAGDSLMVDRFCRYLETQGYQLDRVAMVSEDETAFGSNSSTEDKGSGGSNSSVRGIGHPIFLYYPRDIATLRSAYEQQAILNARQQSSGTQSSSTLRGDLSEPAGGDHDTVRSYGAQLTPLAQESVLLNIVRVLREKKIEFVILRSTNTLDQIFLTQFLRRSYAGARIVIDGADLLFERGAEGTSLRGVMMLSTYPLITAQQEWTRPLQAGLNGSTRIFDEDITEGLYIAARQLFQNHAGPSPSVPIGNYGPPAWTVPESDKGIDQKPSTWISVIGSHQFWPLAVLNDQTLPVVLDKTEGMPPKASDRQEVPASGGDRQPLRIDPELIVLLVLSLAWALLQYVWCNRASITPFPDAFRLAHFAPLRIEQHPALIALTSVLPAMAAVATLSASGTFSAGYTFERAAVLAVWGVLMMTASVCAIRSNFALSSVEGRDGNPTTSRSWHLTYSLIAVLGVLLFVVIHLSFQFKLLPSNRIPLYWRSVHLFSGVSPLLPQILLIAGMYVWGWLNLSGLSLLGDDRPRLPDEASLPAFATNAGICKPAMPMFSQDKAAGPIEVAARPLNKDYLKLWGIILVVVLIIFSLMLRDFALRTLGERGFGVFIFAWLSVCIAIILADTVQLWIIWRKLRPLLVYLDRIPLRRTLASLGGLSWGSVWAMSGNTLEERYRLTSRQLESLRHLDNELAQLLPDNSSAGRKIASTISTIAGFTNKERLDFLNWYLDLDKNGKYVATVKPLYEFQKGMAALAGTVFSDVLVSAWQKETKSLILKAPVKSPASEKDDSPAIEPVKDVPAHVLAAEEFFVLPYIGFIQNVLGRMRTIILGSLFLFVAMTLAASSYPFDPLPIVGAIFVAVFAIAGGTLVLVFAQMHRDVTLSHITNTEPGQLGSDFWLHLLTFGAGPLLGLLTTLFPSIADFVTSWFQPGIKTLQ